ncbi:hypothetical protein X777_08828 [Ooceraea biroi]|uniref:Uncharacterized protein n=1 Tax=Ooceraea biroi TaxID=2015173 RepID=A0A026W9F9_OOCBI|nr:hypothetical protein X777_08828 [Ooceraea biroi]
MCQLSASAVQVEAVCRGSWWKRHVTPRRARHDATRRAKDAPTTGVDTIFLPRSSFLSESRTTRLKFVRSVPCRVGVSSCNCNLRTSRTAHVHQGEERPKIILASRLAEVARNPTDEVQPRLHYRNVVFVSKRFAERSQAGCLRR